MDRPFVVYRDVTSQGVEVVTSVPWEDNQKMAALARAMIAASFQGGVNAAQAKRAVEGVFASALGPDADQRGYAIVMAYHLRDALAELQARQPLPSQPAPQPIPQQQAQYAPPQQSVGAPPDTGGAWGIPAPPVGGGVSVQGMPQGGPPRGAPMGGGGGAGPVQGIKTYSRTVSTGGAPRGAAAPPMASGGSSRGVAAGAQNVKRQAGGFKTYERPGPSRTPSVAAPPPGESNPWAAHQARTAAVLAQRGVGPNGAPTITTTSSESGGEE